jgi:hypothetical protein
MFRWCAAFAGKRVFISTRLSEDLREDVFYLIDFEIWFRKIQPRKKGGVEELFGPTASHLLPCPIEHKLP